MTKLAASVTNSGGASTKAMMMPLAVPIRAAMKRESSTAQPIGIPCSIWTSGVDHAAAMIETAADDDQPHSEAKDAQNGNAAHQVEQIGDRREIPQGEAEDH